MKKYDLNPVPSGEHAVQIHFCGKHYVTSEQKSNGIVVYDSLQTEDDFKMDLYPQLRYTYKMLNQYSSPPKNLIQYETPQVQTDTTSCGIFAVLRAYFILSNKPYIFNPDIGRSYLSRVLEKNIFTNFDAFTSSYIIDSYMRDKKKQLQTSKSGKSTSTITSHDSVCRTTKKEGHVQLASFDTFSSNDSINNYMQDQQRLHAKKMKNSASSSLQIPCNPAGSAAKKRGRPPKYSPEEKKIKDREKRLRYYHSKKKSLTAEQIQKQKDWHKEHKQLMRLNTTYRENERIQHADKRKDPTYREAERVKEKQWHANRRKDAIYREEERSKEKQRHADRRKDAIYREEEQAKDRQWHANRREDPIYREEEQVKDRQWHADRRKDAIYREEERSKEKQWHADRRKDAIYREEEQAKDRQWHADRRKDAIYREEERSKEKQWHADRRKDAIYREEEQAKDRQWHANRREDAIYREEEQAKDRQWHTDRREDPIYREEERIKEKQWHADRRKDAVYREGERVKDGERHKVNRSDPKKKKDENLNAYKRKYGKHEEDAIKKYLAAIQNGPNVVCTCCLQLWFPDNCKPLDKVTFPNPEKVNECKTGTLFDGKEWLCSTCTRHLKENRIPPISYANGVKFHCIPDELKLVQMEERCIALRQPFFQIRELPSGGQKSIKGNVVNVPMDVSKTINQLPRNLNETETIGIKFKKKVSYKKCDYYENIRPQVVIKAARYLIANSELYKAYNVKIN